MDGDAPPAPPGNPIGSLDRAVRGPGVIGVHGWALDPDLTAPIAVHIYVDGRPVKAINANWRRPDVGARVPAATATHHGYSTNVAVGPGDHTVCVYAINEYNGRGNPQLGCKVVRNTPFGCARRRQAESVRARACPVGRSVVTSRTRSVSTSTSTVASSRPSRRAPRAATWPGRTPRTAPAMASTSPSRTRAARCVRTRSTAPGNGNNPLDRLQVRQHQPDRLAWTVPVVGAAACGCAAGRSIPTPPPRCRCTCTSTVARSPRSPRTTPGPTSVRCSAPTARSHAFDAVVPLAPGSAHGVRLRHQPRYRVLQPAPRLPRRRLAPKISLRRLPTWMVGGAERSCAVGASATCAAPTMRRRCLLPKRATTAGSATSGEAPPRRSLGLVVVAGAAG